MIKLEQGLSTFSIAKLLTMKNLLLLLLGFLLMPLSQAQDIIWSDPIEVSTYATGTFEKFDIPPRPRIAVTESGIVNIVWANMENFDANTAHARLLPGEDTFSAPEFLNDGYLIETWSRFGPTVAAHGENVFICYELAPTSSQPIKSRKSTDGGVSWGNEVNVDLYLNGDFATFPHIAVDGEGDPHVSVVRQIGTSNGIGELCSVNGGESYTSFVPAEGDLPGVAASVPFMVIDGDRHMIIWTHIDISEQYFVYGALSTNDGASFSAPVVLNDVIEYGVWMGIEHPEAVVINDMLYMSWPTKEDSEDIIRMARIPMDDLSGGSSLVLSDGDVNDNPTIAASGESILTVWQKSVNNMPLDLYYSFGALDDESYDEVKLFEDDVERYAPSLVYRNGYHLTYVDKDADKIMYMYGNMDGVISVEEDRAEISIYPNPTSSVLQIESVDHSSMEIFNANGKLVHSAQLRGQLSRIDVSTWADGIYFIDLKGPDGVTREKFVKQ